MSTIARTDASEWDSGGAAARAALVRADFWRSWRVLAILMGTAFFAALFVRAPGLFLDPRLWAEEGSLYYAALQDPENSPLTLVFGGNYQFLINMTVAAASMVPAAWAAHVTTAVSAAVALIEVSLIALVAAQHRWHPVWSVLLAVAMALLPHGYEVYLTSTNLQWLCSVSILALCLTRLEACPPPIRLVLLLWVLACGLTGVPSSMLSPVAMAVGWSKRSRMHWVIGVALAACSLVQLAVIASHPLEGRQFTFNLFVILVAPILQSIVMPLLGAELSSPILIEMRQPGATDAFLQILFASGMLLAAAARSLVRGHNGRFLGCVLFGSSVMTTVLNVVGALGNPEGLIALSDGARYFYFATICWLLVAMFLLHCEGKVARALAAVAICMCVVAGISDIGNARWYVHVDPAPSWKKTVDACHDARPCRVKVWPGWRNWTFQLVRP